MIDSHCHLTDHSFADDLSNVLDRARNVGVTKIVTIADSIEESRRAVELVKLHSNLYCTVGIHPHHAKSWKEGDSEALRTLARESHVVGIGEIGLDYHYMLSPKEDQILAFREQLALAKALGLPAVIHTREAVDDTWSIVSEIDPSKIVIHCCTEAWVDIQKFVKRGSLLSFTGIATFPKSEVIRDTIKHCPLSQIMIETDAPYLAPVPYRGKRNEPAFVIEIARVVAEVKNLSLREVDDVTSLNAMVFYGC